MSDWRRAKARMCTEARDALELVVLPAIVALLPPRWSWRLTRRIARWRWPYRAACEGALAQARACALVRDERAWLAEQRLVRLLDHADHFLFRWRGERWLRAQVDVQGQWRPAAGAGLVVTFHWGQALWSLRHAARAGLRVHLLVAPLSAPVFARRWVLRRYVRARLRSVALASGRAPIEARASMARVRAALDAGEQVLVVLDVPPDQVARTCGVRFLGREVRVPLVLPELAVRLQLPLTVALMNVDLASGRRRLVLQDVAPGADAARLAQNLFTRLEQAVRERPASWHLWDQAQRFFAAAPH